jgi:putative transposase
MARRPRHVVPGQPLHVIQRGNNRAISFVSADDFANYRRILGEASRRARCAIHAYVLMTNHVHLLTTPEDEDGPASMMQMLGRRYVRYFNVRQARTGTLWEGRFRSAPIDSERYFFACSRYIEMNPVRAAISDEPSKYRWSSFRCNAYGAADALVTPHDSYGALGGEAAARQRAYRAMFELSLEPELIDDIRRATKSGTTIGVTPDRVELAVALQRQVLQPGGGDRAAYADEAHSDPRL